MLVNLVKHFQDKDEKSYKVFEYDLDNKTVKFGDTIVQDDKEFLKVLKNLHFENDDAEEEEENKIIIFEKYKLWIVKKIIDDNVVIRFYTNGIIDIVSKKPLKKGEIDIYSLIAWLKKEKIAPVLPAYYSSSSSKHKEHEKIIDRFYELFLIEKPTIDNFEKIYNEFKEHFREKLPFGAKGNKFIIIERYIKKFK